MRPEKVYSKEEVIAVGKCLQCALEDDPVLPHWEFPILTGVAVEDAMQVVRAWPDVELSDDDTGGTVHGVLANLIGYPHEEWERVTHETGLSQKEIKSLFTKLKNAALL